MKLGETNVKRYMFFISAIPKLNVTASQAELDLAGRKHGEEVGQDYFLQPNPFRHCLSGKKLREM